MGVPYPKTEWLMHNKANNLTAEQQDRFEAMVRLSDLLNLAMADDVIRTTGKYGEMLFTDFLEKLNCTVQSTNDCKYQLYMDDFVRIARFSVPAVKHIIINPSTHIEKNTEKVHVSKMKQTTSATMRWMARKPGRSVGEKIAPQNKVLTKVTHFSADTKENRETLYLYDILYDVIQERISDSRCSACARAHECGEDVKELYDLISLHSRIRRGDLRGVPAVKQAYQNNKLMCDKYYKMVWDAVGQISAVEEKLQSDWKNLGERYLQVAFWVILAGILHECETVIYDFKGALYDEKGRLWFGGSSGPSEADMRVKLYQASRPEAAMVLSRSGGIINLADVLSGESLLSCDLTEIFCDLID